MGINDWRAWFAWFPVPLSHEVYEAPGYSYAASGNWAWRRNVERRHDGFRWEYRRTKQKVSENPSPKE